MSDRAHDRNPDPARRSVLAAAALATLAPLLPGVKLIELTRAQSSDTDADTAANDADAGAQKADATTRWGMLIDAEKCARGCDACVRGCNEEHGLRVDNPQTDAQWIRKLDLHDQHSGHDASLPMLCQHCEHPPCVDVCPTGASFKRADGIVLVDKHTCIGCRYCVIACPYKARSFIHENLRDQKPHAPRGKGTVEGCTMCVHRVDRGGTPACVEACARDGGGAMLFGDLNDSSSEIAAQLRSAPSRQVRADLGLNTGVRYRNI
ncbi:MAG: sulfate reduction electron transfer complex DsrMKJOP subunit DsrO [bacterium]